MIRFLARSARSHIVHRVNHSPRNCKDHVSSREKPSQSKLAGRTSLGLRSLGKLVDHLETLGEVLRGMGDYLVSVIPA